MSDEHPSNRVTHEYFQTEYDRDGRPEETRKMQVIHDFGAACDICKRTEFPTISAR